MARNQYIYAEPDQISAFMDQRAGLHHTREAAIAENVRLDLMREIERHARDTTQPLDVLRIIRAIAGSDRADILREAAESLGG